MSRPSAPRRTPPVGGSSGAAAPASSARILRRARAERDRMVAFLRGLAEAESPTDVPDAQAAVQAQLREALQELDYHVRTVGGRRSGGLLLARPAQRLKGRPLQLLVGHTDTVWAVGTLDEMPVRLEGDRLHGPGTFDMKAGLTQMVFALGILRDLELTPAATPVLLVNSDEEIGSPESARWMRALARRACRAFVLEPALGPEGRLKTTRKGVGRYTFTLTGRAAHAGLDPDGGASAVLELGSLVQRLHALNDRVRGVGVNVGVVEGGTRPNVVAASARADVDVRVLTAADGRRVDGELRALAAETPGVSLEVEGGIYIPPLEPTPRNRRLWERARNLGLDLGLDLGEATAGGASDGNTLSRFTATLDGLGAVGDGAHALHEHVRVESWVERCALLACLLLAPVDDDGGDGESDG